MLRQTRYVRDSVADERLGCVHSDESGSVRGEDCPIRQGFLLGSRKMRSGWGTFDHSLAPARIFSRCRLRQS